MASIDIQEFINKQNALNIKRRLLDSRYIKWENTGAGFRPHIINMPTQGSTTEDPTKHVYLGTIVSAIGGGSYTVSVSKDEETITVTASLLGWNADYAELSTGQSVYVVFTKSPTLTAQIEV